VGLVGYGITEILTRVFYATRDTRTPVLTGLFTIILNIILCALFVGSMDASGLALSLSVTTGAEAVILMLFLRQRIGQVVSGDFWMWLAKVLAATACMSVVVLLTVDRLERAMRDNAGRPLVEYPIFFYAVVMYLVAFIAFAQAFRISELQSVIGKIATRLPAPLRNVLVKLGYV
jgi:putative peptidoglycan lipid II flippase